MKIMLPDMLSVFYALGLAKRFPQDGDVFLWADSSILILCDPRQVVMEYWNCTIESPDILAFLHPDRVDLEKEAMAAHELRGTNIDKAQEQVAYYRSKGFTKNIQKSITVTNFLFRMQSPRLKQLAKEWWSQIVCFTERDQLSIDFCIWKHNLIVKYLPGSHKNSPLMRFYPHSREISKKQ
ncbi:MAG: glycosyltransferase domain-containing protein [Pseudomonadota bacterium]